jgi:hypothetical protein
MVCCDLWRHVHCTASCFLAMSVRTIARRLLCPAAIRHVGVSFLVFALLCGGSRVDAIPIVTNISGGAIGTIGGGPADVGWEFSVNRQLLVTALGFWDPSVITPLRGNHEVGIWDLNGNLLADGTVLTNSPFTGSFRYVNIAPLTLNEGQTYRIAAFLAPSDGDLYQFGSVLIGANSAITVAHGVSSFAGEGFVFPTAAFGGNGIFGPNFQAEVIPEPATLALLGLGLARLAVGRRSRRRARTINEL